MLLFVVVVVVVYSAPVGIETQTMAAAAAVPFTLSCRGNETPNPRRVSIALCPPSITAIKLNGHTNHIANVFMKPDPEKCGDCRIHQ